jgi:hypothetical protein
MPYHIPHFFGLSYRHLAEAVLCAAMVIWALSYLTVQIVRATSLWSKYACPACHSTDVNLSMRKTIWDGPYRLIRCVPYRCQVCSTRYFCSENDLIRDTVPNPASSANTISC